VLAWLVHLYTALGAVAAFLGAVAVYDHRYRTAFLFMIASTVIDSTDGLLARAAQVKAALPGFDGARLDDLVDYLTFVFVPLLLLYGAGALPPRWGLVVASIVLLASAYGFVAPDAKTPDHFFTGFPSYWNVVALYLYALGLSPVFNAAVLLVLSGLVFVRIGYVYPTRTPALRPLTVALCVIWGIMLLAIVLQLPQVSRRLLFASFFFPAYYWLVSLGLDLGRRKQP
jgi:phosphatidylcholine synthase